jgi:WXG100 protein secretion system (Wss), protein YukD
VCPAADPEASTIATVPNEATAMITGARRAATPLTARGTAGGASTVRSAAGCRVGPVRRQRVNTVVVIPGTVSRPECDRNSAVDRRARASGPASIVAAMESDVCRVAVHTGGGHLDLVLPNAMAVGLLLPSVCDIADGAAPGAPADIDPSQAPRPRQLCPPGLPPLDPSKTLPENGIRDGDALVLIDAPARAAIRPALDTAEHLARSAASTALWSPAESRACALAATVVLAGIGGLLAVPGPPAVPHLLLAASAAGVAAAIAARLPGDGRTAFTALAFGCALIAAATLCTSALGGTAHHTGLLLATVSTAVVVGAGRLALLLCGLSANANRDLEPDADDEAGPPFAAQCLTAIVLAGAGATTLGVALTLSSPARADCAQAAAVTAALLLRARAQRALPQRIALLLAGVVGSAATLVAIRQLNPVLAPWLCALAGAAAAAALWFGHRAAPPGIAPVAHQIATIAECAVLAAIVPLSCWGLGLYHTVGTLGLP